MANKTYGIPYCDFCFRTLDDCATKCLEQKKFAAASFREKAVVSAIVIFAKAAETGISSLNLLTTYAKDTTAPRYGG